MELNLYIFDNSINPLGIIDVVTGLTWEEKFADVGNFELWCPLNAHTVDLLQPGNLLWIGGDTAGVLEFKELVHDETGQTIHVQGRLAESYLDYRTVYPKIAVTDKVSNVLQLIVNSTLISPTDSARQIGTVKLDGEQLELGDSISYQKQGGSVLTEIINLCEANALGFQLKFLPREKQFVFKIKQGTNHSIDQTENEPVLFSSELDDILESDYQINQSDLKNTAYVAGEDSGESRKMVSVGTSTGLNRREIFVDARDLQSKTENSTIPEAEYVFMLYERGKTKLAEYPEVESFSATVRTFGTVGYTYGTDFTLGDTITVYDSQLKVKTDAIVNSVIRSFDEDGEHLELVLGYEQPTLASKLKKEVQ